MGRNSFHVGMDRDNEELSEGNFPRRNLRSRSSSIGQEDDIIDRLTAEVASQFALSAPHVNACNSILEAVCSSLHFDFAEIWSHFLVDRRSTKSNDNQGLWNPYCVHMYSLPHTINNALVTEEDVQQWDKQRHKQSLVLVKCVRKHDSEPLWLTASSLPDDSPIQDRDSFKQLNTVVALPLRQGGASERLNKGSVVFVLYSFDDIYCNENTLEFLRHTGIASLVSIATSFPIEGRNFDSLSMSRSGRSSSRTLRSSFEQPVTQLENDAVDLDMKFELLKDVGICRNGSRCTMYEGRMEDRTDIIIKVVRKDALDKALVNSELQLEINLLRQLHHSNIVRIIGAGTTPEIFLCVERLSGGTLAERCGCDTTHNSNRPRSFSNTEPRAGEAFTTEELLQCIMQIASAVEYLHMCAIPGSVVLHRDLKPDNIGFDSMGSIKLIDFGLSRIVSKKLLPVNSSYAMTGLVGSYRYMAPEVALSQAYNQKIDVYSFGVIVWQVAAMRKPFLNYSPDDIYRKVIYGHHRPKIYENWPEEFKNLIQQCWAHDANMRPNFSSIVEDIAKISENLSHQAIPQPPIEHISRFHSYVPHVKRAPHKGRVRGSYSTYFALDA